jgi:hypothetical protein
MSSNDRNLRTILIDFAEATFFVNNIIKQVLLQSAFRKTGSDKRRPVISTKKEE